MSTEMFDQLQAANSADAMEKALSLYDATSQLSSDSKKEINRVLENITFETTSKFRRRVKRFQETMMSDAVVAPPPSGSKQFLNPPSQRNTVRTPVDANYTIPLTVDESIARLQSCHSLRDVALAMNTLKVPTDEDGDYKKQNMKSALRQVLNQEHLSNKLLRRRISRLIFVLSSSDEKETEKLAAKARAERTNKGVSVRQRAPRDTVATTYQGQNASPITPPLLSVVETDTLLNKCLEQLNQASSAADVEAAIAALPPLTTTAAPGSIDQKLKTSLRDKLCELSIDDKLVSNAKLRRRVKRIKDFFDEVSQQDTSVDAAEEKQEVRNARVTLASHPPLPPVVAALGNFATSLDALIAANTPDELESSLNDLTMESVGTDDEKIAFAVRLRSELSKENVDSSLIGNAKVRRKAKRLLEMLDARYPDAPRASSEESVTKQKKKKDKVKKPDLKNPPAGPPLDSVIERVSEIRSGKMKIEELECSILADVNEQSGNCGSRRLLKRALERIITDDALTSEMTSRTRRKLAEVIETLSPKLTT